MEKFSKEGMLNREAAVAINRGAVCVLNTDNKIELANSTSTGLLLVAEWDVAAGDTLACRIIGASAGTSVCTIEKGTLAVGGKLKLANDGKLAVAETSDTAVAYFLGDAGTTTADTQAEVAFV